MDWMAQIDGYCERTDFSFWSEPLNAVTNASFILAALWAFVHWRRAAEEQPGKGDPATLILIGIVLATGIGSFLFHTLATRWAMLADVVPIALFIHGYLLVALRRFLGLPWWACVAGVIGFAALSPLVVRLASPVLGGSAGYLPALLAIFSVAFAVGSSSIGKALPRSRVLSRSLTGIGLIFLVSLSFRLLDEPACAVTAFGTHFLWHILNGFVLFSLLRVLILQRAGYTHSTNV